MHGNPVAIKTLLLLMSFMFFSAGALFVPMVGVVGYVFHYHFWPDNQWWGRELSQWGLRYAFTIGLCLLIGTILNKHKLKMIGRAMRSHEWLLISFWLVAVISIATGIDLSFRTADQVYQAMLLDKLSKVLLFCLLMSHVVTTPRRLNILIWTMIVGTLYNGYQAWEAPFSRFSHSRLDGIGGPDFRESSFLGAHFAIMLPLIAVQFFRSGTWGRMLCLATGVLVVNGLILTRTRAAFAGVCIGILAALALMPRGRRGRIVLCLVPAVLGATYLMDTGFVERMKTIELAPENADKSATNRLAIWSAAGTMFVRNPLGVGLGNFGAELGKYDWSVSRRDAHNTFIRCASELGVLGVAALGTLLLSCFVCLHRARYWAMQTDDPAQLRLHIYGLMVSLTVMLTCSLFMSQLYIEEFWWFLTLPICFLRSAEYQYACSEEQVLEAEPQLAEANSWFPDAYAPLPNLGLA